MRMYLYIFAFVGIFIVVFFPALAYDIAIVLLRLSPIWAPLLFGYGLWRISWYFRRAFFLSKQKYTLLEIKLPRIIDKSPLAMEVFLTNIHNAGGEGTFYDKYILAKMRPFWSLELVSDGGKVKFYIRTRSFFKNQVEAQLYAQYPDIQIIESEDYARLREYDESTMNLWGCDFKLRQKDAYPILTYIDYGLDKNPKEEYKVDPITAVLELLSLVGPQHQLWVQIVLRARKGDQNAGWFKTTDRMKDEVKAEIKKMLTDLQATRGTMNLPSIGELSDVQQRKIKALERSLEKLSFEAGIRAVYFGPKETYDGSIVPQVANLFKPFASNEMNTIVPTGWLADFAFPWQDFGGRNSAAAKKEVFRMYRRRAFFDMQYWPTPFVLTTEEVATIYHFPGDVARTPMLEKIQTRRMEAPSNLPI